MHRPGFNALCAQVLAAVFALSACGGRLAPEDRKATDIPGASEPAVGASSSSSPGSLVAQVYLPAGVSVTTVSYTVSGASDPSQDGSYTLGATASCDNAGTCQTLEDAVNTASRQ